LTITQPQFRRQYFRPCYVALLRFLVPAAQQNDQDRTTQDEVSAISWSVIDPQLRNACPDRSHIARLPGLQTQDSLGDAFGGSTIFQPI